MATTIRVAVLGTGHMAQAMVAAARHVDGVAVTAIVSREAGRAEAVAAALGIPQGFGSLVPVLADDSVDALYIANETANHAEAALAALAAGKAVLCEKPFAVDLAEATAVRDAAVQQGRLFMEAIATPFLPAVAAALTRAAAGEFGRVHSLVASFGYPATPESHPGCWRPRGGGVLLDRTVYLVTLARLALGPVAAISARVTRDAAGIDVDAALLLTHADGGVSQLTASLTVLSGNDLTLSGTWGSAMVQAPLLTAERLLVHHSRPAGRDLPATGLRRRLRENGALRRLRAVSGALRETHLGYGADPYIHELIHFRDLWRAGATQSPVLPPDLSLDVAHVLATAREQAW